MAYPTEKMQIDILYRDGYHTAAKLIIMMREEIDELMKEVVSLRKQLEEGANDKG